MWGVCGVILTGFALPYFGIFQIAYWGASFGLLMSPVVVLLLIDTRLLMTTRIVGAVTVTTAILCTFAPLHPFLGAIAAFVGQFVACLYCNARAHYRHVRPRHLCPTCEYDLRGLAPGAICPECGPPIVRSPRVVPAYLCTTCNYDLRGLPPAAVCPECGEPALTDSRLADTRRTVP